MDHDGSQGSNPPREPVEMAAKAQRTAIENQTNRKRRCVVPRPIANGIATARTSADSLGSKLVPANMRPDTFTRPAKSIRVATIPLPR